MLSPKEKMRQRVTLLVLLITVISRHETRAAEAINPMKNSGICGIPTCDIDLNDEKFHYQQNTVYKYLYESSVKTHFDGTDNNDPPSELHISAHVELTFPTKCQGQLKITSAQLKHHNITVLQSESSSSIADYEYEVEEEKNEQENFVDPDEQQKNILHNRSYSFARDIEKMNIVFEFRDGLIEEICPGDAEQVWVTNFKRGIISAFQNTMTRFDLDHKATEIDVSGKCDVSYEFVGAVGTSIMINKTKDISSCQNRNKFKSIIQTTPYEFRKSGISWWPIFKSNSYCEMSIDNHIYNNIECHERHILIPFSNANNGAVTKSFMRLKLIEEANETSPDDIFIEKRRNLLFDHTFSPKPIHNDVQHARSHLIQMCNTGPPNIQREFPDQFVKFLSATRQLSLAGLRQLLGRAVGICHNNKNGRKHVLESLPYIESSASIELMKSLLMDRSSKYEITKEIKDSWMLSMFYLPRPDQKVIESMFSLIQFYEKEQNPMYVLIPSSVVHTYCRNGADCKHDYVVQNIVRYLEENIIADLPKDLSDRKIYEKLLVAMKGIGNIGIVSNKLRETLKEIIVDESYMDDVKLQAIQLFRKTYCDETRDYFMDIYRNFTQSVEVRISSYNQVMKCPTYLTIKDIKEFLSYEKVNQVGSYVWSHLTNLGKTSSPLKVQMQALLADNKMDEKFNLDFRKFSKNYEYSLFFEEYNFGVTGESNVIFGIESYIPRSISFNGTVNLFGGSINPFEFNIRMQGLEKKMESIFGLEGSLNFARIMEVLKSYFGIVREFLENYIDFDLLQTFFRPRRSVDSNLLEGFAFKPNYDFNKPSGYFEHKIYGNDINFNHFSNFDELNVIVKKIIPFERVKNIFSSKNETFIDSGTVVDVSYSVPSSVGFPLVLSGFGAYSVDVSYFASINNENPFETKSLDFTGKLVPSLSMELNTAMQVDLFYDTTEVKFKSNIYSNYALETAIALQNYTKASVKLQLPKDRNDIFSIRTQLLSKLEGTESLLYGINDKYNGTSCTWPAIDETIGLQVCVDYNLPDVSNQEKNYPSLIFSGPINFDIHLDKADLSAKIFTFDYNWKSGKSGSEGSVVFETPNTKIPRKLSAVLITDPTDYNFTMKLINGEKIQTFLGKVKYSPLIKSLDFSVSQNDKTHLLLEMKLLKEIISKSRSKTTPLLFLTIQDQKVFGLSGVVSTTDKNNIKHHQFSVTCETKRLYSVATGTLTFADTSMTLNTELSYKFPGREAQTVDILLELANRSQKKTEFLGSLQFESSAYPNLNFILNGTFISSLMGGHAELRFDFNNAPDLMNPQHTLTTRISLARNDIESKTSETTFFIEVKRPLGLIDFRFYVKYDERYKNGTEHNAVVKIRISPDKEAEAKASVFLPKGNLFGLDATFLLQLPDMGSCSAKIGIMERMRKDYLIDMSGEWFSKENITIRGNYEDRTSNVKRFYKLKTYVRSNMFDDVNIGLKYSRDLNELKLHAISDYKSKSYSLIVESLDVEPHVDIFRTELNWADLSYSLNANISQKGIGRSKIEIHIDRIRDIHVEIWGTAKTFSKNAGIEFKWDANRDPSQKFIFSYDFNSPRDQVYVGNILMSYPERTINGEMKITNEGPYTGLLKISWSSDEIIDASYSIGSQFEDFKKLWAVFKVDTPFQGWKNNRVNSSIFLQNNIFEFNFNTMWAENQHIDVNFFIDYLINEREISSDYRGSIHSTIANIPKVYSYLKYKQTSNEVESDIYFKYENKTSKVFSMKTHWKKSFDLTSRNITGSITFLSPIENYTSGVFVTKFSLTKDRELYGVIDMDVDSRLYGFTIEGYLKRLFDNMISFNISTPIETFPSLLGKFGINDLRKYLIADLKTLNKSLGIEILFDFHSITDFDLKFYAATPQPAFERILAIGTIRGSVMHLEGGWNKINIGFKRISHYGKYNDFEYSYQVFTPLAHFEQNGIVFKFIGKDIQNFDIETSFKLGKYKLGVQAFGEPKKQLINQLGLQKATYIREEISTFDDLDSDEASDVSDDFDIDLNTFYSLVGHFEVCTIIWSPITGNYEVQQIDETFHGSANILIPKGAISISNRFVIKSQNDMTNRLKINTPIPEYNSLISNFKLKINDGFTTRFDVGIKNKNLGWKTYGFKLNYALPKSINSKIHDVSMIILYPIMGTSRININSRVELTKSGINKANFSLDGFGTKLVMLGFMEKTSLSFNSAFSIDLQSPVLPHYLFNTYVKKTTVDKDNKILAGFQIDDSKFDTELHYRQDPTHIINGYLTVNSNIFPIHKFNSSVFISENVQEPRFDVKIRYEDNSNREEEIKFLIVRKGDKFDGEISAPITEISLIDFAGEIIEQSGDFIVKGKLFKNTVPYNFDGTIGFTKNIPSRADLTIKNDIQIKYELELESSTRKITANVSQVNGKFMSFESELFIENIVDWAYNVRITSSRDDLNELKLSTSLTPESKSQYVAQFVMMTPWKSHMIDKVNISSDLNLNLADGSTVMSYEISKFNGNAECAWRWQQKQSKQDYMMKIATNSIDSGRTFKSEFSYLNPSKSPADAAFSIDINSIWMLSTKAKFDMTKGGELAHNMFLIYDLSLPQPIKSTHHIEAKYKGSSFPPRFEENSNSNSMISYSSSDFTAQLNARGKIDNFSTMTNYFTLEWGNLTSQVNKIGSDFSLQKIDEKSICKWELLTPSNRDEKTIIVNANYDSHDVYKVVHADINYPESNQVVTADVAFLDMQNAKGAINSSLPIFNVTWFHIDFDFDSIKEQEKSLKLIRATWPENYALIDSMSTYKNYSNHQAWTGAIKAEIPLQTRHNIQIIYGLEEKPLITTGHGSVEYNTKNILNSTYTCRTEKIGNGQVRDVIDLSIENEMRPIGIHYTHEKKKRPIQKYDYNKKHLELFDLTKDNRFNITGEFIIEIKDADQQYKLIAIHPNRTIMWTSNFKSLETETHQSSKVELAPNIWLAYDFELKNTSKIDEEGQVVKFELSYPTRKIIVGGNYLLKSDALDTDILIKWNKREEEEEVNEEEFKSINGVVQWKDLTDSTNENHQSILFALKHPKFEQDVTLLGTYFKDKSTLSKIDLDIKYTEDEDHHAKFIAELKDLSDAVGFKNYSIHVRGDHPVTSLEFFLDGSVGIQSNLYKTEAVAGYKRSYLSDQGLELIGFFNADTREIKYYRQLPSQLDHIYGIFKPNFPIYVIEGIYVDSDNNTAGQFIVNLKEKSINGDVNLTEDASQRFQMKGLIPDTRSAVLNIWRDYEDKRIDDVSYFVQMNHSRLITSKFLWRPKIKKEIKENLKRFMASRYNAVTNEMDYWVHIFYTETKDIIADIWDDAKSYTEPFYEDLSALKDIDEDLLAFRNFMNDSYNADDFYIQSLMNYTSTFLEDLAIADHIQTIPKFFKEMWTALGESSSAFSSSIQWIVNMMKSSYKESLETFNKLLHGNAMEYVTQFLNTIIENYDKFVKELHIKFINYVEIMWDNLAMTFSSYWNKILQSIEPQIIRSIHYVETTLWSISSEIFDFMNNRTNEIIESPYFMRVSNITRDLDTLYSDMKTQDLFTNFKKYSGLLYKFAKEKILRMPFAAELREVLLDLGQSLKELRNVEGVKEYFDQLDEIQARLKWLMNEFQLDKRLNVLLEILKKKLARITQNALEAEDVYREAKTKFIYDPEVGKIEWEQKLPISWHAFNETPQFEEIPEYQFINDVQKFLFGSKNSSWSFYYGIFLNEPQNLVPPFKAHALLVGSRHIITFDKTSLEFSAREFSESNTLDDQCSYLLAHDFIDGQFTITLQPSTISLETNKFMSKTLIIKTKKSIVEIELGNPLGGIKVGNHQTTILPTTSGDLLITRELNVVTVASKTGFKIQCNLEFDVCHFEMSGWYFGKIAGIFGTMNNEIFDDLTTSDNEIIGNKEKFIESWITKGNPSERDTDVTTVESDFHESLYRNCDTFFKQKTSYFTNCFLTVNPQPFYEMCIQLGNLPRYQTSSKSMEQASCTSAIAYIDACAGQNIPLRIPDTCIHCNLPNGSYVTEGIFNEFKDDDLQPAVDVVFLMESSSCNDESSRKRMLSTFVTSLTKELKTHAIDEVRFAVVAFGGSGDYERPKSITSNGRVFTDANNIQNYFDHIMNAGGSSLDVFSAVTRASELIFKPGAVKIFILSVCSECQLNLLKFDFKSVSQLLNENDITLHLLSNDQFKFRRAIGVDSKKAYLRTDRTKLVGDETLRAKIEFDKKLDLCASLALGTDGSIFSGGNKTNENELKTIANVFAKRVAVVHPRSCQICECEGHNSGAAYFTCFSCDIYQGNDTEDNDDDEDYLEE